jgi:hypothetical protein
MGTTQRAKRMAQLTSRDGMLPTEGAGEEVVIPPPDPVFFGRACCELDVREPVFGPGQKCSSEGHSIGSASVGGTVVL